MGCATVPGTKGPAHPAVNTRRPIEAVLRTPLRYPTAILRPPTTVSYRKPQGHALQTLTAQPHDVAVARVERRPFVRVPPSGSQPKGDERQRINQEPRWRSRALSPSGDGIRSHGLTGAPTLGDQLAGQHRTPRSHPVELAEQVHHVDRPLQSTSCPGACSTTRIPATTGRIPLTAYDDPRLDQPAGEFTPSGALTTASDVPWHRLPVLWRGGGSGAVASLTSPVQSGLLPLTSTLLG